MKLLLTSDLHCDETKFRWLLQKAPSHDALLVAGDLLNLFSPEGAAAQIGSVRRFSQSCLNTGRSLILSSGNHDFIESVDTPCIHASPSWLKSLPESQGFITDGSSRLVQTFHERFVTTTVPWPVHDGILFADGTRTSYSKLVSNLIGAGNELRNSYQAPWVILMHEPPAQTPLIGNFTSSESEFTRQIITCGRPDFTLHGHVHTAPLTPGGSWHCRIGPTVCFNAGQSPYSQPPNFILLEMSHTRKSWNATWFREGEPAESIDHLT